MKNNLLGPILCSALLFVIPSPVVVAQSQQEMNREAADDFAAADRALNKTYKLLLEGLDEESVAKLKSAQRAWIQFRDAAAEFESDLGARGGSMAPLIYNGRRADLTKERNQDLQRILKDQADR